jgi:Sulfatase-modifying factor enzyme 1/Caspase domain
MAFCTWSPPTRPAFGQDQPSPDACSAAKGDPIDIKHAGSNRVALLITNQDYPVEVGPLTATHKDGEFLCRALVAVGFSVRHVKDASAEIFDRELRNFAYLLSRADTTDQRGASFFYFSGHGAVADEGGPNYLIPVGEKIVRRNQLVHSGVNLDRLIEQIRTTAQQFGVRNNFVIIDACRNPAFPPGTRGTRGFRAVAEQSGLMIGFSTSPGLTAVDAHHYSMALAEELQVPDQDAYLAFRAVRRKVLQATSNRQFPWMHDGLVDAFYFKGDGTGAPPPREQASQPRGPKVSIADGRPVIEDCDVCPKMLVMVPPVPPPGTPGPNLASFAIGTHEVTFDEWQRCIDHGGCRHYAPGDSGFGRGKRPVINVSFRDAQLYLEWLSVRSGKRYRLPTEAEWEYAARADGNTPYINGDDPTRLCDFANGDSSRVVGGMPCNDGRDRGTEPVGHYRPNTFGLYDMTGNVWEWIDTCYKDGATKPSTDACDRVIRGGSWSSGLEELRISSRRRAPVAYFGRTVGFRVARSNP